MLINSVEIDFAATNVPDPRVGWGRVNLDNVLYFPGDSRKLQVLDHTAGLTTGERYRATVKVGRSANEPLRVTLVWTDYPAQAGGNPALVNDLNLELTSPLGKNYRGNNFSNNSSAEGGEFDVLNTVENVFLTRRKPGIGR